MGVMGCGSEGLGVGSDGTWVQGDGSEVLTVKKWHAMNVQLDTKE